MAVSVAVCEMFSVKEWCDLENMVRVTQFSSNSIMEQLKHPDSDSFCDRSVSCFYQVLHHLFVLRRSPLRRVT